MNYSSLPIRPCGLIAVLPRRFTGAPTRLDADVPAMAAITDFARECPITLRPDHPLDDALAEMIRAGVRALLVVREGKVLGLITSYDIQGERPIRFLRSPNCLQDKCRHSDVKVGDIMTPCAQLPALSFERIKSARLGDLVETFRGTDATHLLVTDAGGPDGCVIIRGIVSRTRLQRHLGEAPVTGGAEQTPTA